MIKVKPVLVVEAGRSRIPPSTTLTFLLFLYIETMFSISAGYSLSLCQTVCESEQQVGQIVRYINISNHR